MKMASSAVTIKIEKATLQLLEELREETNSRNFDEVIRKLTKHFLLEKEPVLRKNSFDKAFLAKKSFFGAHPEISSFTEKNEIRFHEL
jgi:metal-responsive CopG/Arc/MetJ family transcriptional regulator